MLFDFNHTFLRKQFAFCKKVIPGACAFKIPLYFSSKRSPLTTRNQIHIF